MSEEMLLNELIKIGWNRISRSEGLTIFSFNFGIRHCMIDILFGRLYAYSNSMEPSYLTCEEADIFKELTLIYQKGRKEKKEVPNEN